MNKEIQRYTVDLNDVSRDIDAQDRTLVSRLGDIGFKEGSHVFSAYDAAGPNGSRDPPANYQFDSEEIVPLESYQVEGETLDREAATVAVNKEVSWMKEQTDEWGEAAFYTSEIADAQAQHPDIVDRFREDYFTEHDGAFWASSAPSLYNVNDSVRPEISIWNAGDLSELVCMEDGFPDGHKPKNAGIKPVAIVEIKGAYFPESERSDI